MHGSESCCNSLVYVSSGPSVDSFLKLEFCQCFHPSSHEMALTWFFWICLFFFLICLISLIIVILCVRTLSGEAERYRLLIWPLSGRGIQTHRHIYMDTYMQTPTLSFHGTNIVAMRALELVFGFLSLQPYSSTHMSHLGLFS